MIRILQAVNIMDRAGLETLLMNYYRHIDRNIIQFDFLTHRQLEGQYDSEIISLGGRIFQAPRLYPHNYLKYFIWMKKFFLNHPEYKIVHSHIDTMSAFPLMAAKLADVPIRIAHSHSTGLEKDLKYPIKSVCKKIIPLVANQFWACGNEAGKFLYNEDLKFNVIHNAINSYDFRFQAETREEIRKEFGINDNFVIGHVGRFLKVKNHDFLIDIFLNIKQIKPNAILVLVGVGEIQNEIKKKVENLGLQGSVLFLGSRSNINQIMQGMDVFVLPSLYEGIPVVGIEAQAAGLPCFFSDKVPSEVALTPECKFISISDTAEYWAREISEVEVGIRENRYSIIYEKGYDISLATTRLMNQYLRLNN